MPFTKHNARRALPRLLEDFNRLSAGDRVPMALPGTAGDRTEEEQQAINYAYANGPCG